MYLALLISSSGYYGNSCNKCVWQELESMSCTCDIPTTASIVGPLEGNVVIPTSTQDAVINLGMLIFEVENAVIEPKLICSIDGYITNVDGNLTCTYTLRG
jgi:hypothetical protein